MIGAVLHHFVLHEARGMAFCDFYIHEIRFVRSGVQSGKRQVRKFLISRRGEETDFSLDEARFGMTE